MLAAVQRKAVMAKQVQHERDMERFDKYLQIKLYGISCRTGYGFRETEDMSQVSDLSNLVDQFKYVKQVNIGSRAFFQGSMLVYQSEFSRDKEPIRERKRRMREKCIQYRKLAPVIMEADQS